jgi:ribonuclease P protein component
MLPLKNRLKKKKDFKKVFKEGEPFKEDFLFLKRSENNLDKTRLGFIVSLKVSKKAFIRNKVKRRLREAAKNKIETLKNGYDVVIIARGEAKEKEFKEIEDCLEKLFKKSNILND